MTEETHELISLYALAAVVIALALYLAAHLQPPWWLGWTN